MYNKHSYSLRHLPALAKICYCEPKASAKKGTSEDGISYKKLPVSCDSNMKCPHRFVCLNTWCPVGVDVLEELRSVEEVKLLWGKQVPWGRARSSIAGPTFCSLSVS